jgi:hypothetical protein
MLANALLLAAFDDIIGIIVVLLFFIGPVIFRVISAAGEAAKGQAPAKPREPNDAERQIDDFVRQISGQSRPASDECDYDDYDEVMDADVVDDGVGSTNFNRRAEQLGDAVEQADERMEGHLQQIFDHSLGQLAATETVTDDRIPLAKVPVHPKGLEMDSPTGQPVVEVTPSEIAQTIRSPHDMRKAIILSEILTRPTDRWN